MWKWLADRLIARAMRTPYIHLEGYMNRWWLIPYNRFGIAVRIHEILRSDADRDLHDHPWWYVTIILRGGYWERTEDYGWPIERDLRHCWTLFITGPKRKDHVPEHSCWGFLVEGEKVPADVYLGDRYIATDYTKGGNR